MEALAAGGLEPALEPEVVQPAAQRERREGHSLPAEADVGIEIEHDEIGALDLVGVGAPGVDLERAELRERDEARQVVDLHVRDLGAVALDERQRFHWGRRAGEERPLEEAVAVVSVGTADQGGGGMPAFGPRLDAGQLEALAAYVSDTAGG